MTLVSSIINDALRETNIIPIGQSVSDDQNAEGLRRLQTLVSSVLGNEAGEQLIPMALGNQDILNPAGFPWYGNALPGNTFVPCNMRMMLNLTGPGLLNLHPKPDDGARMGVVDVAQTLGTYGLTINGNGRSIEGDEVLILQTSSLMAEWFYRADLGNWVRVTNLTLTSDMPFPPEFDDLFIIMLAARINPRYGQTLDQSSQAMLVRARTQFRARYKQDTTVQTENALVFLTNYNRMFSRYSTRTFGNTSDYFNSGYTY